MWSNILYGLEILPTGLRLHHQQEPFKMDFYEFENSNHATVFPAEWITRCKTEQTFSQIICCNEIKSKNVVLHWQFEITPLYVHGMPVSLNASTTVAGRVVAVRARLTEMGFSSLSSATDLTCPQPLSFLLLIACLPSDTPIIKQCSELIIRIDR